VYRLVGVPQAVRRDLDAAGERRRRQRPGALGPHQRERRAAVPQAVALERRNADGIGRERHQLHPLAMPEQPRQQLVGHRVRPGGVGQEQGLPPAGRGEPADPPAVVDGHDARGHSALVVHPLADLLGADLRLTEPRGLLRHSEGEDVIPVPVGGRARRHQLRS
jgi:hypothetical protein